MVWCLPRNGWSVFAGFVLVSRQWRTFCAAERRLCAAPWLNPLKSIHAGCAEQGWCHMFVVSRLSGWTNASDRDGR